MSTTEGTAPTGRPLTPEQTEVLGCVVETAGYLATELLSLRRADTADIADAIDALTDVLAVARAADAAAIDTADERVWRVMETYRDEVAAAIKQGDDCPPNVRDVRVLGDLLAA